MKNLMKFGSLAFMAMLILSIALLGILQLMTYLIQSSVINQERIIALNLAREGIEVVRSVRDSNWMTACPTWGGSCTHWSTAGGTNTCCTWDSGLNSDADHTAVLDFYPATNNYILNYVPNLFSSTSTELYVDTSTGLYLTDLVNKSDFKRLLNIDYICRDADDTNEQIVTSGGCAAQKKVGIQITSTVQWDSGDSELVLVDKLYNWK
jgi:type II secretory pathway pseudopilin PulG